jgi:hypothetical protein
MVAHQKRAMDVGGYVAVQRCLFSVIISKRFIMITKRFFQLNLILIQLFFFVFTDISYSKDSYFKLNLNTNKLKAYLEVFCDIKNYELSGSIKLFYELNINDYINFERFNFKIKSCVLIYKIDDLKENKDEWIFFQMPNLNKKGKKIEENNHAINLLLLSHKNASNGILYINKSVLTNLLTYIYTNKGKTFKLTILLNNNIFIYSEYNVEIFNDLINFLKINNLI